MLSRHENGWLAALLLLAGIMLAGCAAAAEAVPEDNPAQVEPIEGTDRSQVTLTEEGAGRVGIQTEPVGLSAGGTGGPQSMISLAAVLYDKDGKTWTYTNPSSLTFVPRELVIDRIEGDTAILASGPPPGTEVVTVGGAELLGAEYGVPGE